MNKILILALTTILTAVLTACSPESDPVANKICSKTGNDIITIDIGYETLKYEKVDIMDHKCWIRHWQTKIGTGSDILHIDDLCDKCAGKKSGSEIGDSADDDTLDY